MLPVGLSLGHQAGVGSRTSTHLGCEFIQRDPLLWEEGGVAPIQLLQSVRLGGPEEHVHHKHTQNKRGVVLVASGSEDVAHVAKQFLYTW